MFDSDAVLSAVVVGAAATLSWALILYLRPVLTRHLMAHPNERSSHVQATPEGAGFGVMAAVFAVCTSLLVGALVPEPNLVPVLIGAAVLVILGGVDDARPLPVTLRLLVQGLVALGVVLALPQDFHVLPALLPAGLERAMLVFGMVCFVNIVNFLDGLDWMTVAQVIPMSLGIAILWWLDIVPIGIGVLALALFGAMLGFAIFNRHPASIFLGDSGSLPIGLLLATMLIWVAEAHFVSAVLLALYTIADSGLTFFRRLANGEKVTDAHRSHFYQRATVGGFSVPEVTTRILLLCTWLAALAIVAALGRSLLIDGVALALGVGAVGLVLTAFARGR
ncbi:MAG: glycosyl transferase [Methyloceanibacter sp.]|nr:glycosyl transferase [Methyloceanibacter sp.]